MEESATGPEGFVGDAGGLQVVNYADPAILKRVTRGLKSFLFRTLAAIAVHVRYGGSGPSPPI